MRIRNKHAVLRTRYYTLDSDKESYDYSLLVCHLPFRDESSLLLDDKTAESCFLRRQTELRPLQANNNPEEFAHAEQIIQRALTQATALNAARQTLATDNEWLLCADEKVIININDNCDDNEERIMMPNDVFINTVRGLNIQQQNLFQKVSAAVEADLNGAED